MPKGAGETSDGKQKKKGGREELTIVYSIVDHTKQPKHTTLWVKRIVCLLSELRTLEAGVARQARKRYKKTKKY